MMARLASPMSRAAGTVFPSTIPRPSSTIPSRTPVASTEKPSSFGSWPTRIMSAIPFM